MPPIADTKTSAPKKMTEEMVWSTLQWRVTRVRTPSGSVDQINVEKYVDGKWQPRMASATDATEALKSTIRSLHDGVTTLSIANARLGQAGAPPADTLPAPATAPKP